MKMKMTFDQNKLWQYILVGVTFGTTFFYIVSTGHIWEDFFITFRHSKNLVDGNGLVYQPGERVHGFTSVINTLLPAFYYWISGKSFIATLWLYKVSSIVALIFGAWFFLNEYQKKHKNVFLLLVFFSLLFAFEAKTIMFATNGQEAGFMLLFLLPSLIFAYDGYEKNWLWAGICWAGLIYTRPDGVVYIAILALSAIVFGHSRNVIEYKAIIKTALCCGLLYLPWFIGAWIYYGSPVPHTITAKASVGLNIMDDIVAAIQTIIAYFSNVGASVFQPMNYGFGGWPYWIGVYSLVVWLVCFIYWVIPSSDRFGRFVSFVFSLLVVYFAFLKYKGGVYAWYLPPASVLGCFILISAFSQLTKKLIQPYQNLVMYIVSLVFVFSSTTIYFMTVAQIQVQQEVIENGHRKEIGLWLKKNINSGDSIFLESLGYIGYFSDAKMLDWPGLVSPEVVRIEQKKQMGHYEPIIKKLKPSWVTIRPFSYMPLLKNAWFVNNYKYVKTFNVRNKLNQYKNLPGVNYLYNDAVYLIFKKKN
jgi:hypothetical protein